MTTTKNGRTTVSYGVIYCEDDGFETPVNMGHGFEDLCEIRIKAALKDRK